MFYMQFSGLFIGAFLSSLLYFSMDLTFGAILWLLVMTCISVGLGGVIWKGIFTETNKFIITCDKCRKEVKGYRIYSWSNFWTIATAPAIWALLFILPFVDCEDFYHQKHVQLEKTITETKIIHDTVYIAKPTTPATNNIIINNAVAKDSTR